MARVTRIERHLVGTCLLGASMLLSGACVQAPPKPSDSVIRATRIEIVDATGKVRGIFGPDPSGRSGVVGLYVLDHAGRVSASIANEQTDSDRGFGLLVLNNTGTGERTAMAPVLNGGLTLADTDGVARMQLMLRDQDGLHSPALVLRDRNGCGRAELMQADHACAEHSYASLTLSAACGDVIKDLLRPSVSMSASEGRQGEIFIFGKDGQVRTWLPRNP